MPLLENRIFGKIHCIDSLCINTFKLVSESIDLPIYLISYLDIENFTSDEPYGLWIIGNEQHLSFDDKFINDINCQFIIKPYPFIPNYSPVCQPYIRRNNSSNKFYDYSVKTGIEDPRVINIPLGPSINFIQYSNIKSIDIGFYGQVSGIRQSMIPWIKDISGISYSGFGISRSGKEYSDFISKCKISFCPSGHSPETYRLFESSLAGCAVISNPLPDTDYYNDCPAVTIPWQYFNENNFNEINKNIDEMLGDIHSFQTDMKKWAEKWTNPNFISNRIKNHIKYCT